MYQLLLTLTLGCTSFPSLTLGCTSLSSHSHLALLASPLMITLCCTSHPHLAVLAPLTHTWLYYFPSLTIGCTSFPHSHLAVYTSFPSLTLGCSFPLTVPASPHTWLYQRPFTHSGCSSFPHSHLAVLASPSLTLGCTSFSSLTLSCAIPPHSH